MFVDHVLIVGNVRTSTSTIERELQVKAGDPFSLAAINESQRRLTALGLFRRARITELRHGDETTRDLLVTVEEAPPTTIGYGGGFEVGRVDRRTRRRRRRHRAVRLRAARLLRGRPPQRVRQEPIAELLLERRLPLRAKHAIPIEYRVIGTFREPRVFDTAADAFVNATVEQQRRSSFNFSRRSVSADLARKITRAVSVTGSYQIQRTRVFDEKLDPPKTSR